VKLIFSKMPLTRRSTDNSCVGQPKKLSHTQLPTKSEVLSAYLLKCNQTDLQLTKERKAVIFSQLADNLIEIWVSASLKTIEKTQIIKMFQYLTEKYQTMCNSTNYKRKKNLKEDNFVSDMNRNPLFDVCICRCFKPIFKRTINWETCTLSQCSCDFKIAESEWEFYKDQQQCRKLFISSAVDRLFLVDKRFRATLGHS
jgi:hypothetical protein